MNLTIYHIPQVKLIALQEGTGWEHIIPTKIYNPKDLSLLAHDTTEIRYNSDEYVCDHYAEGIKLGLLAAKTNTTIYLNRHNDAIHIFLAKSEEDLHQYLEAGVTKLTELRQTAIQQYIGDPWWIGDQIDDWRDNYQL